MSKNSMNLQDSYLNQVRKDGSDVRIVLLDGTELSGKVRGFDNFTLILNTRDTQNLIYKHAIAQMVSQKSSIRHNEPSGSSHNKPYKRKTESSAEPSESGKEEGFNKMDLSNVNLEGRES